MEDRQHLAIFAASQLGPWSSLARDQSILDTEVVAAVLEEALQHVGIVVLPLSNSFLGLDYVTATSVCLGQVSLLFG